MTSEASAASAGGGWWDATIAARVVPFGVFIGFLALDTTLSGVGQQIGMDPRWWYGVRSVVVAALLAFYWSAYDELRPADSRAGVADWVLAVVVGVVIIVAWVALDFSPLALGGGGGGYDPRTTAGAIDWRLALVRAGGSTLVVPVMEELFWRSFLMRWMERPAFQTVSPAALGFKAIAVSAVLFGVEHTQWFAGILAGLGYAWLYIRTRNLWVPILAHAVSNGVLSWWVISRGAWGFW
jgi:CAAX prenyl protease-like protein